MILVMGATGFIGSAVLAELDSRGVIVRGVARDLNQGSYSHERPERMDEGTLIMSGLKKERVLEVVKIVTAQYGRQERVFSMVEDYQAGPVCKLVSRVVLSYTDYVNRTVWHKI